MDTTSGPPFAAPPYTPAVSFGHNVRPIFYIVSKRTRPRCVQNVLSRPA
ncbi:unnamed protein product, partial [marine sediment metagenome]